MNTGSDTHWSTLTFTLMNESTLVGTQQADTWNINLPSVFDNYQLTLDVCNGVSDMSGTVNVSLMCRILLCH